MIDTRDVHFGHGQIIEINVKEGSGDASIAIGSLIEGIDTNQ